MTKKVSNLLYCVGMTIAACVLASMWVDSRGSGGEVAVLILSGLIMIPLGIGAALLLRGDSTQPSADQPADANSK